MKGLTNDRAHTSGSRGRPPAAVQQVGYLVVAMLVALTALAAPAGADERNDDDDGPVGAVYLATNAYSGNSIQAFDRFADGSLAPAGPGVPTGGLGSGPGAVLVDDPLGSQNSLIVDQKSRLLFAANAGSDDVSVFAIDEDGLTLVDRQPSGAFPVSVAFNDDTLYVLNAIDHSVTGFDVDDDGELTYLQTCVLPELPAGGDGILPGTDSRSPQPVATQTAGQVGFSPDGKQLIVVSKEGPLLENFPFVPLLGSGRIHVYDVDRKRGTLKNCGDPTTTVLSANSDGEPKFPFSFAWDKKGNLLLTEIFGAATSFTGSAVSSFDLDKDGSLTPISESVGNGQAAVCWIVVSGNNVYVTNFLSDSLSSFEVTKKGVLTLTNTTAASFGPGGTESPIDMAITADGRFIYQLSPGSATIRPFEVDDATGALTPLPVVSDGLDAHSGQSGIATFDFDDE